jgi:hypothetical protein
MKDIYIEFAALFAILSGLILGYFLIFDYNDVDAFFLEEDNKHTYLEAIILSKIVFDNNTVLDVYGCREFEVYSTNLIEKNESDSIFLEGEFRNDKFILSKYK